MDTADLLIHPIGELATTMGGKFPAHGKEMSQVRRVKNGALAVAGDTILAAGTAEEVLGSVGTSINTKKVDASNKLVTAGLVDPHTHLVFDGNRANEFVMRCQGKTYAEIAEAGGGIVASMKATRSADLDRLVSLGLSRLQNLLSTGTTTCEVKTGYGLDSTSELRMLEAVLKLQKMQPVDIVPTFMPAHAFPTGCDHGQYVRDIIDNMLPRAAQLIKTHGNSAPVLFNDVFCDQGYFTLEQTREILETGAKHGLRPKVHADEFVNLGATPLAVELNAASADHLLNVHDADIEKLAKGNTVAVLLPGTSFFLNLKDHAPARKMIDNGVAVALGSDFNPGSCHIFSLPIIWGLACLYLRMTAEEVLTALTFNAAHAIGMGDRIGTLEPGKQADILIYGVSCLEEVPYNFGWSPIDVVFKKGVEVFCRG